ncbi:Na+/H+ antiporter NhaC [Desulfobaculum xiamenense]|uniref:Na+/H+ antiporter NhaC n=1 Tax=Desulfobaculum xiamenense TaxID=995050 RepID=A0A846QR96_9BACT|nr:Na+/H+ antiporter NhaC family protein [Desulfobaculum xiamenense]NJB69012.1 Na+/H+ antiporter NhaC [Desulfobaculum xiamenense]
MNSGKGNALALLPLAVFLVIFIGAGVWLTLAGTKMAFYQVSATVAILPAIVLAVLLAREKATESIGAFIEGAGDGSIVTMCMIYLLAGAFAKVAGAVGGVESTVNLGLSVIPASMVLPGLFVIGAFISTAMGTSMGTIAAVAPIAVGVAAKTDISLALLMGAVVGGAMFGDNLSMISDTTIAATRTQGCDMQDKFKLNFKIALPAAILSVIIFAVLGASGHVQQTGDYQIVKVLPYVGVLGLALAGVNVFIVLAAGIVFAGAVGLAYTDGYTLLNLSADIYGGFTGMQEILVLSLMIGGLGALIKRGGGIDCILAFIERVTRGSRSTKAGELSIAALVSLVDVCTANNTVAIIVTGGVAKEIAEKNNVDMRRSASLLDIFSCVIQGIIPYGAQVLLAGSIAAISPINIVGSMYYCYLLAAVATLSILLGFPAARKR